MRIVDELLLAEFREAPRCQWCGRENINGLDPHHVLSRGAGRLDVRNNLVALCRQCHGKVHAGRIHPQTLLDLVAKRCRSTREAVLEELYRLRRLPKGATP